MVRMAEVAAGVRCEKCGCDGSAEELMHELHELRQRVDELTDSSRATATAILWMLDHTQTDGARIAMEILRGVVLASRR